MGGEKTDLEHVADYETPALGTLTRIERVRQRKPDGYLVITTLWKFNSHYINDMTPIGIATTFVPDPPLRFN